MFMARNRPLEGKVSEREALRLGTLERRQAFHSGEAIRAALQGSNDKAATHSGTALSISRELCAGAPGTARHQAGLAAALCNHACYGSAPHAIALLTESAGHYAVLAQADPARYEVPRIGVLTQIALTADAAGNTAAAVSLLREVIRMYLRAPAADLAERDVGLARARFRLGRCLLKVGTAADGLAETDAGLALADEATKRLGAGVRDPGWLGTAPRYVQLTAPDWAAAAVRAMTLHSAAGRYDSAATAARAAVRVSGGLAGLGGDTLREAHEEIRARASAIWALASRPRGAAAG